MATDNSPVETKAATEPPYSATTSDGEARPVRKIKPPSPTFMKLPDPAAPESPEPAAAAKAPEPAPAPAAQADPPEAEPAPLPKPAPEPELEPEPPTAPLPEPAAPAEEELLGPAASGHAEPTLGGPAPAEVTAAPVEPAPVKNVEVAPERIAAELKELDQLVSLESLKFLQPRVNKAKAEGADPLTLLAFYRLAANGLKEEAALARTATEQYKREFEKARARMTKMEVEFAGAVEHAKAASAAGKDTEETTARVAELQKLLDQANEQREKLMVDVRNVRDRAQKDIDLKVFKEKEKFFTEFLLVLDGFDQANRTMNEASSAESLLQGMKMLSTLLMDAMEAQGLEKVNTGGSFDPRFHEAVGMVETQEKPDDHVYDCLQTGYRLGERLIRAAMVRIARNPSGVVIPPPGEEVKPPEDASDSNADENTQE